MLLHFTGGITPVAPHGTGLHQPSFLTTRKCQGMKLWVRATAAKSIVDNFCEMVAKVLVSVLFILSSGSIGIDIGNNSCKYR